MSMRVSKVRFAWDKFKVHCPKVGYLTKIIYTARFARSMSSLYTSGVSMLNSLVLAKETINNVYIASQFDEVIRQDVYKRQIQIRLKVLGLMKLGLI